MRRLAVALLTLLWLLPVAGLAVTSFRDREAAAETGWWRAPLPETRVTVFHPDPATGRHEAGAWVIEGTAPDTGEVRAFGLSSRAPAAFAVGTTARGRDGLALTVAADGAFRLTVPVLFDQAPRFFLATRAPARFTTANYARLIRAEGFGPAILASFALAVPATVLPLFLAAFAAHALVWIEFPGRALLVAGLVGLMALPLQPALVPLLRAQELLGIGRSFPGIWLAHTGFGLPLAIWVLRSFMRRLPREIVDCARLDGVSEARIFARITLPLCLPGLAGFAVFQFLWIWNDLFIASVFLGGAEIRVLPVWLREIMDSHGGEWEMLAAAAMLSMMVPLAVFLALHRVLLRGLPSGAAR
ncbi:MAG: carbohydrate ABC transporter permease [Gemmobacter sp.]|jgi:alpha-glucoside transport system permease protein|nr:carbohydrate ABC transporter permease [Gemmobacter sp.]